MKFTVEEILIATNAKVLKNTNTDLELSVSTDTRTIQEDNIYLGLKGERFDGENFIENAIQSGCKAYFTTTGKVIDSADLILKIDDSLTTYLQLANFYKEKVAPKTIALTGSSGKTTTKEMLTSVCKQCFKTHSTPLNHNNEVGFCQTILSMPADTEVLILEMGMRGLGEIELLSKYATPDITIITNVGTSHIGRLGSKENIAKAKCEIVKYQKNDGCFIAHNNELIKNTVDFNGKKIFFKIDDVTFKEKTIGKTIFTYKNTDFQLNIEGDYNVENSLAVIEAGLQLNMPPEKIADGLKAYSSIEKRWDVNNVNGYTIINDSYNANPDSMKAALSTVLELYPNSNLVLGNMGELGNNEVFYHQEIADFILKKISDVSKIKVLTVGSLAKEIATKLTANNVYAVSFEKNQDAVKYITQNIEKNNTIFLKASRSMKFEEILEGLKENNL